MRPDVDLDVSSRLRDVETCRGFGKFPQGLRPTRAKTRIFYDPSENTRMQPDVDLDLDATWRRGAGSWRGAGTWRDVSSVLRDLATGNVTQRGAKRLKNARSLAMLKGI
jgi:hypothetical protein